MPGTSGSFGGSRISAGGGVRASIGISGGSRGASIAQGVGYGGAKELGPGGGAGTKFSSRGLAEFGKSRSPTLTIDKSRISSSSSSRTEIGRPIHTVLTGAADLGRRTDISSPLNKSLHTTPDVIPNVAHSTRAYATAGEIGRSSRKDVASIRTQRALQPTRLLPVREPGRQSIAEGGSTGRPSTELVQSLLQQRNFTPGVERAPVNITDTVQIRPDIISRPPIASPNRVVPDNIRQVPITEKRTLPAQTRNERSDRNTINGNVIVVDFVSRRRVATGSESGQRAPSTQELEQVLRDTSPKVELVAQSVIAASAKPSAETGRREAEILTELSSIDQKASVPVRQDAKITDSNVLPLRKPDNSRSASKITTPTEKGEEQSARKRILAARLEDAGVYVVMLESLKKERDQQSSDEEKRKRKKLGVLLLERVKVLQRKLQEPAKDPANAPVKILQLEPDAGIATAPNRQRMLQTNAKPDAQIVSALEPEANVIPLRATRNAPRLGTAPAVELLAKKQEKKQIDDKEKVSLFEKMGQKIKQVFSRDESTNDARRITADKAIEAYANPDGTINGEPVAAALGKQKGASLISSLLKTLGFLHEVVNQKISQIDGSLAKLQLVVAGIKRARKKEMRDIVYQQSEQDPAVKAGGGRGVDASKVELVLNGVPLPKQIAA